jgi:RHH-type proline utilization regulon transcriptional repressor/proline dehydrogenase/delta 1-pyrroline-5-carboxylate dehydrogenase
VRRQPFGGWKKSAFSTAKAGGPNYVLNLCQWRQVGLPHAASDGDSPVARLARTCTTWIDEHYGSRYSERLMAAAGSYLRAWSGHFSREHDPSNVFAEVNVFRYRPIRNVLIRVGTVDDLVDGVICVLAAATCGVPATWSTARGIALPPIDVESRSEDDMQFIESIASFERIRAPRALSREAHVAANSAHTLVIDVAVLLSGRLELRHYLREQSVTQIVHRYGTVVRTA